MRPCALCGDNIACPDYLNVGDKSICRDCRDAFVNALLDENESYFRGIERDKRTFRRVRPSKRLVSA